MNYNWFDLVGNIGVALILIAYLLLQLKRIKSEQLLYSFMNGIGAILIIVSLIFDFNLSAFIIEFFWLLISIFGIFRTITPSK